MNSNTPLVLPENYEVLITDVQDHDLRSIGDHLGVHRLSVAEKKHATLPVHGIMRGISVHMFVPLVVSFRDTCVNVLFLIDTGSPNTYIRTDTLERLGFKDHIPCDLNVEIQGTTLTVYLSHSHFANVDLLGQDFMTQRSVRTIADYRRKTIVLEEAQH